MIFISFRMIFTPWEKEFISFRIVFTPWEISFTSFRMIFTRGFGSVQRTVSTSRLMFALVNALKVGVKKPTTSFLTTMICVIA